MNRPRDKVVSEVGSVGGRPVESSSHDNCYQIMRCSVADHPRAENVVSKSQCIDGTRQLTRHL
jgi:hypothetical protein